MSIEIKLSYPMGCQARAVREDGPDIVVTADNTDCAIGLLLRKCYHACDGSVEVTDISEESDDDE